MICIVQANSNIATSKNLKTRGKASGGEKRTAFEATQFFDRQKKPTQTSSHKPSMLFFQRV